MKFQTMKRYLSLIVFLFLTLGMGAKNVLDVFNDMPDSLVSYLDASQRQELTAYIRMKGTPVVVNTLGDSTSIVAFSDDYIKVRCNEARDIEIKVLKQQNNGDTILCVVSTYKGPAEESTLRFYSADWKPLENKFVDAVSPSSLLAKPDSISDDDFHHLCDMIDPLMVKISLSPNDKSMSFNISLPNVPTDKKKELEGLLLQRKLNWNGTKFN